MFGFDGYPPTGDDFGPWVEEHAYFAVYATRLSDLKTAKIVEIADNPADLEDEDRDYSRYMHEGGERCIVNRSVPLERGNAIFDGGPEHTPVVYSSFAPKQMVFKFGFWEWVNGDEGGSGPAGEVFMSDREFRDYLRWHARWKE